MLTNRDDDVGVESWERMSKRNGQVKYTEPANEETKWGPTFPNGNIIP